MFGCISLSSRLALLHTYCTFQPAGFRRTLGPGRGLPSTRKRVNIPRYPRWPRPWDLSGYQDVICALAGLPGSLVADARVSHFLRAA